MKSRFLTTFAAIILSIAANAQFAVTNSGGYLYLKDPQYNLDALILLNKITPSSEIRYTGTESDIEWVYTDGGATYTSNQREINPEDGTLYHLRVNGTTKHSISTIDYSEYLPAVNSLTIDITSANECENITLIPDGSVPGITYPDRNGSARTLPRTFTLEYTDTEWQATSSSWEEKTVQLSLNAPLEPIQIATPKTNTTFRLWGDAFAEGMSLAVDTIYADYQTRAIECHPLGTVVEREYKNEKDRSGQSSVEGSGPLVVEFTANANPADIIYYEWLVANVERPEAYQRYNDQDLRYTFEDSGEYTVRLNASNNICSWSDSINVRVNESLLEAPNAFSPNGDGINDEWRVVYRSIDRYSCIIQNRWGRTVFTSDNPGKGWDGTINGRPAAEGTYYYSIVAYGTDLDIKGKPMKYRLSGDINLIR